MPVLTMETLTGGQWVRSDDWIDVYDPSDVRRPAARVPALHAADVVEAYDAAAAGFATWRARPPFDRARIMFDTAVLLRERADDIAEAIVTEMGKTRAEARGEVGKSADFFEYYASIARGGYGTLVHDARPNTKTSYHREPIGIVLAVTPWNDPFLTPSRKLAPALAAGNSAVLKPASETPMSSLHLARALHDAGLPPGVLNVVTGRGSQISEALLADPRVAAVTFTGSNDVGERLRGVLASRNVRFQAEMGGKNATVVLRDADLEAAATAVVAASFGQAGQRCTATSRVVVEQPVSNAFIGLLRGQVEQLHVGPGRDLASAVCPLVSPAQRDSVAEHITRAVEQGARMIAGGGRPADEALRHGCYVTPTILAEVTPEMDIWRHEVFGPVIVLSAVDGLDAAIDAVNDSDFGLAAAVFTHDLAHANRFADEVECGQISVNTTTTGWDVHHPFGGFRDSGSAFKEQGEPALHFYTRVKTVAINYGA